MSKSDKPFWIGLLIIVLVVGLAVFIWGIHFTPLGKFYRDSMSPKSNNITLAHIDSDGTVWVEIGGNLYYLYISDNGTSKRLEWIK